MRSIFADVVHFEKNILYSAGMRFVEAYDAFFRDHIAHALYRRQGTEAVSDRRTLSNACPDGKTGSNSEKV